MKALLHPTYFPNIAHFVAIANSEAIVLEFFDNYQKQTLRNRTYIFGPNGKLALNIPVVHTQKHRQLYKDVKIAHDGKWQAVHWKSIKTAYSTSPFFEFYEDDIAPLFEKDFTFLMDFNQRGFETVLELLQLELPISKTIEYQNDPKNLSDYRQLVICRNEIPQKFDAYIQVFSNKHGFISNLSILDLLFNEGPNALNYLENQKVNSKR